MPSALRILLCLLGLAALRAQGADVFQNFQHLSQHEVEDVDYRVRSQWRGLPTVFVIHGGGIEFGSSQIGTALIGNDWSGYFFEGIKLVGNAKLHLSSTRFDEPRSEDMLARASHCISIHGFVDDQSSRVCVGGGDSELAHRLVQSLSPKHDFSAEICADFPGTHPKNLVNRCGETKRSGLQLEISSKLRRELLARPERLRSFVDWVRGTLEPL